MGFLAKKWHKALEFVYPAGCLLCEGFKDHILHYLCKSCQNTVKLKAFLSETSHAYCFEECMAMEILLKRYRVTFSPHLRDLLASWMVVQFISMNWEMPDYIVPAVEKEVAYLRRNQANKTLAQSFSKMLGTPILDLFKFRLEEDVYTPHGELLGEVALKPTKQVLDGKKLLIITDQGDNLDLYRSLLEEKRIERVWLLGIVSRK